MEDVAIWASILAVFCGVPAVSAVYLYNVWRSTKEAMWLCLAASNVVLLLAFLIAVKVTVG